MKFVKLVQFLFKFCLNNIVNIKFIERKITLRNRPYTHIQTDKHSLIDDTLQDIYKKSQVESTPQNETFIVWQNFKEPRQENRKSENHL